MTNQLLKIQPYTDYLYLQPFYVESKLVGGSKGLERYGKVIAVGPDVKYTSIGDIIGYEEWDIKRFDYNNDEHIFLPEKDSICKIIMQE